MSTKGRQTYCPIADRSVTAPVAYKNIKHVFDKNTRDVGMGCLDWIKATMECFEKPQ